MNPHPGIGPSPVQAIVLVARFTGPRLGATYQATSSPGHLLQAMIHGSVDQACNGREYRLTPGSGIWYHEDEWVTGKVLAAPWRFYSVSFIAPGLPPPPFEARHFPGRRDLLPRFERLLRLWESTGSSPMERECRAHAVLLEILAELTRAAAQPARVDESSRLWWNIETQLRGSLKERVTLAALQQRFRRSPATIARSCRQAVGVPPLKRLKQIRLSLARGLVRNSMLRMTEIAERVGYPRLHEFSRDYSRHFGVPPSRERKRMAGRGV